MNKTTSACPECGNQVEIEHERRLYDCGKCKALSYLNAKDADQALLNTSAVAIGREKIGILLQRECELSTELLSSRDRLERFRAEQKNVGRKRKSTLQILTANMVIIAASALLLSLDLTVDSSQLVFAAILLMLTILTLMFLFLQNSMVQSSVFRMEVLEEEERKVKRELDDWRAKIDLEFRSVHTGGNDLSAKKNSIEE